MAAPCSRFIHLENRLNELAKKFVADQIAQESANPLTFTPDTDRLAAFRLLAHAELEEFLEQKAQEGLDTITEALANPTFHTLSQPQIFVIALLLEKPIAIVSPFTKAGFLAQINELLSAAREVISKNNGIKESSFFKLAVFSGKRADEVDQSLALSLTSYGKSRGDVAHKSTARVRTINAPSAEATSALDLLVALKLFFYGPASPLQHRRVGPRPNSVRRLSRRG